MKKFLLSSVALLGFTAGAMAADLPRRAPPVFVPVPVFTWTGFYVGVNAGYGWSNNDDNCDGFAFGCFGGGLSVQTAPGVTTPFATTGGFFDNNRDNNRDGFVGGAQVGFNYQFTPGSGFVVGVEADIQWMGNNGNNNNNFLGFGNGLFTAVPTVVQGVGSGIALGTGAAGVGTNNVALFGNGFNNGGNRNNNDWFATARLRLGYAFDRTLIYVTGGVAFTDDNNKCSGNFGCGFFGAPPATFFVSAPAAAAGAAVTPAFVARNNNNNDVGWVLGAGVEYAFTNNLTVKLEGLWVNLDRGNNNNFAGGAIGVSNTGAPIFGGVFGNRHNDDDFFVARVGVNWKFGS